MSGVAVKNLYPSEVLSEAKQGADERELSTAFRLQVQKEPLIADVIHKAWRGDFAGAGALIAESDNVAAATGSQMQPFAALRLQSLQGREAEASALIETTIDQADAGGQSELAKMAQWAATVLYNGLARYDDAVAAAREVTTNAIDPWQSM